MKKLNFRKYTISKLQLNAIKGGVHDSDTPECQPSKFIALCITRKEVKEINNF